MTMHTPPRGGTFLPPPVPVVPPAIAELLDAELSVPSRLGHVCLLVAASLVTVAVASQWATETALPARTQWAFAAIVVIGLSWAGFAAWVLRQRRPLLARDRVVAGWMSVVFTTAFACGALLIGVRTGAPAALAAAATGATLVGAALVILVRARQARHRLEARRAVLERLMSSGGD